MNVISKLAALSLAVAGSLGTGVAQAHTDVQWSVSIGGPIGVSLYSQPYGAPVYTEPVVVRSPLYVQAGYGRGWHDSDRDGIPNRYDHRYNPRWDRDGDGIPNRYDRHYNPHGDQYGHGGQNRRHDQEDRGRGHDQEDRGRGHDQGHGTGYGHGQGQGQEQGRGQGHGDGRGYGQGDGQGYGQGQGQGQGHGQGRGRGSRGP